MSKKGRYSNERMDGKTENRTLISQPSKEWDLHKWHRHTCIKNKHHCNNINLRGKRYSSKDFFCILQFLFCVLHGQILQTGNLVWTTCEVTKQLCLLVIRWMDKPVHKYSGLPSPTFKMSEITLKGRKTQIKINGQSNIVVSSAYFLNTRTTLC